MFRLQGMSKLEAAENARSAFYRFFEAAQQITEEGNYPFRMYVQDIDLNQLKEEIRADGTGNVGTF